MRFPVNIDSICGQMLHDLHATAAGCINKEVHELSEHERFCIAYASGVPMIPQDMREAGNRFKMQTVPCSITKLDGRFVVFHQDPKNGNSTAKVESRNAIVGQL